MNLLARWFGTEPFNDSSLVVARGFDRWMMAAVVVVCLAAVVLAWRSMAGLASIRRRILVFVPRLLAITIIGAAVVQPELELRRSIRLRNSVAVLIDASASMGIRVRDDQDSRAERVAKFFQRNRAYLGRLEKDMDVKYFSLAEGLTPVERDAVEKGLPPTGKRSNIICGIKDAAASLSDARPKAILLFTDGVETEEGRPEYLRNAGAPPVHIFFPGEDDFRDAEIAEIRRDDFAFIRTPWTATAIIRVRGFGGREIPVTLKQGDSVIMSQAIATNPAYENVPVQIRLVPTQTGKFFYTLSIPRYADEAVHENNEFTFGLNVIRDKTRILHVCGKPSWDSLFLRRALKLDPNIDLVSLFILRTPMDMITARSDEMSLIPFPVNAFLHDDLASFDVVLFQNFAYGPYKVGPYLSYIREYVKTMHGAFAMVGGDESFAEGHYFATPIEDILPVDVPPPGDTVDAAPFRARLTEEGKRHPITVFDPDDARNREIWDQLPELDGCNKVMGGKRDNVVLVDHPSTGRPIVVVGEMETGRSMAVAADTLWHWNFLSVGEGHGNRHYLSFWKNAIRWLIHDPALDFVKLSTEHDTCVLGERIDISATVTDHTYKPVADAELDYNVFQVGKADPVKTGRGATDGGGRWEYRHSGDQAGLFRLEVGAKKGDRRLGAATISFLVKQDDTEYRNPAVAADFIREAASVAGGDYFDLSNDRFASRLKIDNPKVVQLLDRRCYPLWNNWLVLVAVVMLLSVEWTLRRRLGLS